MTRPPVRIAMSSSMAFRQWPNSGGLTATARPMPFRRMPSRLTTTSGASSSAMISSGLPVPETSVSRCSIWAGALMRWSVIRISGSSSTARIVSTSVTMWCEM